MTVPEVPPAAPAASRAASPGVIDMAVIALSALLLLSMGGAMVAAPVTVPLLIRAARRRPSSAGQILATVLAAATMGELLWATVYLTVGEAKPWIWLVPLSAAAATAAAARRRGQPRG